MRRSTVYAASSWCLSLAAHALAVLALARMTPVQAAHSSDSGQSREILLLPPAPSPAQPEAQKPPPPPAPTPKPEPVPTPPELSPVILGIDDGSEMSKNWLGGAEDMPHSGPKADQDQAQFTPAPGIPVVGSGSTQGPSSPLRPAPQSAPSPAPLPVSPPAPQQADPTPPAEELKPASPPPPAPRQVAPSKEQPEVPDAKRADTPKPGASEPGPADGPERAPAIDKNASQSPPAPNGELPAPNPAARPDGDPTSRIAPRQQEAPAPAPAPPEGAAIDPKATPNPVGDPNSTAEKSDTPSDQTRPSDAEPEEHRLEDQMQELKDRRAAAAQNPPAEFSQPAPDPSDASADEQASPSAGEQGQAGAPVAGDRPGIQSDRESDAAAVVVVPSNKLGKPLAAKGLNITTVRPRWSTTTLLTTAPKSPLVQIEFRRDGAVVDAKFVGKQSTGYLEVDDPLLDAIHKWRAKGKQLDQLPPGRTIILILRIQLR